MKISSGKFRGRKIKTFFDPQLRPTMELVRATVFNICRKDIENAKILDLFAGTGAIGLEALSQGASHVTFIDKSPKAVKLIRENIKVFSVENSTKVYCQEAKKSLFLLGKSGDCFDLIYIDPPYHVINENIVKEFLDEIVINNLLNKNGNLFIEGPTYLSKIDQVQNLKLQSNRYLGETLLLHYQYI